MLYTKEVQSTWHNLFFLKKIKNQKNYTRIHITLYFSHFTLFLPPYFHFPKSLIYYPPLLSSHSLFFCHHFTSSSHLVANYISNKLTISILFSLKTPKLITFQHCFFLQFITLFTFYNSIIFACGLKKKKLRITL